MLSDKRRKIVLIWLYLGALLVFAMVMVGGATRLTHSGLSMVEWKLIMGSIPPLSEADWQETFLKYQDFPEYKQLNSDFTLEDFKGIFWWEYIHRTLGRFIGLVFLLPFLYFLIKKWLSPLLIRQLLTMFFLGGFQGFLGWFMVESGLQDVPYVSHYRLATHLITATVTLGYILWVAFRLDKMVTSRTENVTLIKVGKAILGLILLQIAYGAFVAGLKAGFVFNTFPKMGEEWIPEAITSLEPWWKNFSRGLAGVQFIHRYLAFIILGATVWLLMLSVKSSSIELRRAVWMILLAIGVQILFGIATLVMQVPISIALLHQAVAMLLMISVVSFLSKIVPTQA